MKLKRLTAAAVISVILFFATAAVCIINLFPPDKNPPVTVTVPDLVGSTLTDEIRNSEYFEISVAYSTDDLLPPDTVTAQSPSPGAKRKAVPGGTKPRLYLTVSRRTQKIKVPTLTGLDSSEAQNILKNAGFSVAVELCEGRRDRVISVSHLPDTELALGSRVTLYVGKGQTPESIIMPRLLGVHLHEAAEELLSLGLYLGEVRYFYSESIPAGDVISQSRPAGAYLPRASRVSLDISLGKELDRFQRDNQFYDFSTY